MRDAAFVKACELVVEFRKQASHWKKLLFATSDELSAANKALTDIAKHCGLKAWTIPQLVESVGLALAERDSLAGTYSLMQRDHEDGFKEAVGVLGDPAALQEALSKMTKERDAQSALVAKQRHLLAAKQTEIGALEAERDDLRKIVEMVHADLGIQRGDHVGEAISELKKEASDATARQRRTEVRALKYSAQAEDARREIERLRADVEDLRNRLNLLGIKAAKQAGEALGMVEGEGLLCAAKRVVKERDALRAEVADLRGTHTPKRSHPVAVGGYLRRLSGFNTTPAGEVARVLYVDCDGPATEYTVKRPNGQQGVWSESGCEPCGPPADHDTPAGKQTAQAAVTPQPGDVRSEGCMNWPLSCVEIVKGGDK